MNELSAWWPLFALGAGHGTTPAMGWLFAVALGFQRGSRRAVWSGLGPLAAGHALAMIAAIGVAMLLGLVLPPSLLKWLIAALLVGLGLYRLVRSRHITYGGMLVNSAELATWSFQDRKSTRLNSSHMSISYAVFCLKKKKKERMK